MWSPSEPEEHGTKSDALNLRNNPTPKPEEHSTKNDALNLRFVDSDPAGHLRAGNGRTI